MPTTTVFLSYLTNTARRHGGAAAGVPRVSPCGTIRNRQLGPSPAPGATWTVVLRVGEGELGAVGWGRGARVQPRTAAPLPRGARRSPRPGARTPLPGLRVSGSLRPGLSSQGSAPKLAGCFAAKVGRTKGVRSPRERVRAGSTGPPGGREGDRAAEPPWGRTQLAGPRTRHRGAQE